MIIINIITSDVLSTQGVRSSRDMVLTKFAQNIPVSAAEEFISSEFLKQEQFFSYTLKFCKHVHNSSDYQISCAKVRNPAVIKCHELRFETPLCVGDQDTLSWKLWQCLIDVLDPGNVDPPKGMMIYSVC